MVKPGDSAIIRTTLLPVLATCYEQIKPPSLCAESVWMLSLILHFKLFD